MPVLAGASCKRLGRSWKSGQQATCLKAERGMKPWELDESQCASLLGINQADFTMVRQQERPDYASDPESIDREKPSRSSSVRAVRPWNFEYHFALQRLDFDGGHSSDLRDLLPIS